MIKDLADLSRRRMLFKSMGTVGGIAGLTGLTPRLGRADTHKGGSDSGREDSCHPVQPGGDLPVEKIAAIMQTNNYVVQNGVLLVSLGRNDLSVTGPNGHVFYPAFAPNHKFFFEPLANGQAFMNAEFTFLPSELPGVINAILFTPLEVMAEHQHYIGENPQTFHFHFRGIGEATSVAEWAIQVVKATHTPLPQHVPQNLTTPLPYQAMARHHRRQGAGSTRWRREYHGRAALPELFRGSGSCAEAANEPIAEGRVRTLEQHRLGGKLRRRFHHVAGRNQPSAEEGANAGIPNPLPVQPADRYPPAAVLLSYAAGG